ncbi:hypothetical protein TNCV_2629281 [Trichonephila clavipes]|uniref:Uncharacterized protein n=1 Tax=Trichonephila clavipes TaxID=2585209 RepID=A0A8X6VF19_TRICX|nr:hypothetical protein TNCV_2629281 [Trichonephila clavipes]
MCKSRIESKKNISARTAYGQTSCGQNSVAHTVYGKTSKEVKDHPDGSPHRLSNADLKNLRQHSKIVTNTKDGVTETLDEFVVESRKLGCRESGSPDEKMPENDENINVEATVRSSKIPNSEELKAVETTFQYFEQQGALVRNLLSLRS